MVSCGTTGGSFGKQSFHLMNNFLDELQCCYSSIPAPLSFPDGLHHCGNTFKQDGQKVRALS